MQTLAAIKWENDKKLTLHTRLYIMMKNGSEFLWRNLFNE